MKSNQEWIKSEIKQEHIHTHERKEGGKKERKEYLISFLKTYWLILSCLNNKLSVTPGFSSQLDWLHHLFWPRERGGSDIMPLLNLHLKEALHSSAISLRDTITRARLMEDERQSTAEASLEKPALLWPASWFHSMTTPSWDLWA